MRRALFYKDDDIDDTYEVDVYLREDRWSDSVFNDLEAENYHEMSSKLADLITLLPQIQRFLEATNSKESKKLAKKLEYASEGF